MMLLLGAVARRARRQLYHRRRGCRRRRGRCVQEAARGRSGGRTSEPAPFARAPGGRSRCCRPGCCPRCCGGWVGATPTPGCAVARRSSYASAGARKRARPCAPKEPAPPRP
eukprot:scaffold2805_cov202-Prasinococcus_capsulatus_cf.AAC.6